MIRPSHAMGLAIVSEQRTPAPEPYREDHGERGYLGFVILGSAPLVEIAAKYGQITNVHNDEIVVPITNPLNRLNGYPLRESIFDNTFRSLRRNYPPATRSRELGTQYLPHPFALSHGNPRVHGEIEVTGTPVSITLPHFVRMHLKETKLVASSSLQKSGVEQVRETRKGRATIAIVGDEVTAKLIKELGTADRSLLRLSEARFIPQSER